MRVTGFRMRCSHNRMRPAKANSAAMMKAAWDMAGQLNPVTRMLSDLDDHVGSILVFAVMLTGCLALGQAHESLRLLHLFLAEALLVYFPFSKLMHAFTFVMSRGYTGATMGRKGVNA